MSNIIIAAAAFLAGWFIGFVSRRHRARHVRERLQREIDGLQELIALERMKLERVRTESEEKSVREATLEWLSAIPEPPASRPARPARPAQKGSSVQ